MKYRKLPHSKLHHVETRKHDDGTYRIEAHVSHRPPMPEGKKDSHMAYAAGSMHDEYPNRVIKHGADTKEEASEIHADMLEAHQHEKGTRRTSGSDRDEPTEMNKEAEELA